MSIQSTLAKIISLVVLLGCASEPEIADANYPLVALDKAIRSALVSVRSTSQNKREYVSDYLTTDGRSWDPLGKDEIRAIVTVAVVGDRRPYDIRIETVVEEKQKMATGYSSGYKVVGSSKKLSAEIQLRIRNYLRQNAKRNLIDDFKPF